MVAETAVGIGVVIAIVVILAYSLYHVFRLEAETPTGEIVPDEPR